MVFIGKDEQLVMFQKSIKKRMPKVMMAALLVGKRMQMLKLWIEKKFLINASKYPSGLYQVIIETEEYEQIQKLVIE